MTPPASKTLQKPLRTKIFGVDPGLATGLAFVDISDRMNPVAEWAMEADTETFYRKTEEVIEEFADILIVVCENFIITPRTATLSQAPWSLMGRGVVENYCMKFNVPWEIQTPASMKDFSTTDKLHAAGFWHVGGEGHANDAYGHILKYHADRSPRWAKKLIV